MFLHNILKYWNTKQYFKLVSSARSVTPAPIISEELFHVERKAWRKAFTNLSFWQLKGVVSANLIAKSCGLAHHSPVAIPSQVHGWHAMLERALLEIRSLSPPHPVTCPGLVSTSKFNQQDQQTTYLTFIQFLPPLFSTSTRLTRRQVTLECAIPSKAFMAVWTLKGLFT